MLALIVIVIVIALVTWAGWVLWRSPILFTESAVECRSRSFIQKQVRYQASFLALALLVTVFAGFLTIPMGWKLFGIGLISAPVQADILGLAHVVDFSWLQLGCMLTLGFGLATYVLVSTSLRGVVNWVEFIRKFGGWIIVLAAVNALSEELIFRGAVVSVAEGRLGSSDIALLSAVLFALAHIRGQAAGIAVIAGSAIVGWCLAHAVLQTHGLFVAWCAHFAQDVVIFAGFIATTGQPPINIEKQ